MSSELQYEHIENKIREASENIPYAFDQNAWKKMEAKLDERDKRRPFFWLWLLLPIFLGAGWFFVSSSNHQKTNNNIITATNKNVKDPSTSLNANTNNTTVLSQNQQVFQEEQPTPEPKNTPSVPQSNDNGTPKKIADVFASSIPAKSLTQYSTTKNNRKGKNTGGNKKDKSAGELAANKAEKTLVEEAKTDIAIRNATPEKEDMAINLVVEKESAKKEMQKNIASNEAELKKDSTIQKDNKTAAKKSKSILSKLYVAANVGGEISSVKLMSFNNNPIVVKYGLSVGYEFNKKIAIQLGVFKSNKKYVAGANDYNVKQGTYLSMVNITSIDADCSVYEIPLSVRYNFLNRRSIHYYTSAGISSFIMKKEDYNYHYKRYNSILMYPYSYTGNQHLFSNMQLAVGIEKKINNRLAIQMEPSISIPLSGVGEGKVRLYESNLQLGIKYHPFK